MMTGWARRAVRDFWAVEHADPAARLVDALLAPAELPFRAAVGMKNAWYERRSVPSTPIPVVSVGNLTVGGTGKTPVVRWLGEWLRRAGARTAIVARGYGQDEVALYRRWFGADAVFAGRDRRECVRSAGRCGFTVSVLDDGFQHRRLARALDILLVAVEDPLDVRLLPRGPYRESPAAARRAAVVLLTRRTSGRRRHATAWREKLSRAAPAVPLLDVRIRMGGWSDLSGAPTPPPAGDIVAMSAIARPGPFASGLAALLPGANIKHLAYADHHDYTDKDVSELLRRLGDRTVVCTAKDAVKLASFPELAPRCAVVGFRIPGDPPELLRRVLAEAARRRPNAAGIRPGEPSGRCASR